MRNAIDSVEPNPSGYIREDFLEEHIEEGLNRIARITEMLTEEANSMMRQVNDIVSLPYLDDDDVQQGIARAKMKRNDTVQALYEFDSRQTFALRPFEEDVDLMARWLSELELLANNGVTEANFSPTRWAESSASQALKREVEQRQEKENVDISFQDAGRGLGKYSGTDAQSIIGKSVQSNPTGGLGISGVTTSSGGKNKISHMNLASTKQAAKTEKKNKVLGFLKDTADFLLLDDVKTVFDPKASLLEKGSAIFSVTPTGKMVKVGRLGFKFVRKSPFGKSVVKKVDETVALAKSKQRSIIQSVENGTVELKTNKRKGNYGEMKMDVHFESQGYTRVSKDRVTGLDDKIAKGIDGVYEKKGPPSEFIIGEAKYNTAQLGKMKDGTKQMSDPWIKGRLDKAVGTKQADSIREEQYLNPENVQSMLIKINDQGKIAESILDEKAKKK